MYKQLIVRYIIGRGTTKLFILLQITNLYIHLYYLTIINIVNNLRVCFCIFFTTNIDDTHAENIFTLNNEKLNNSLVKCECYMISVKFEKL